MSKLSMISISILIASLPALSWVTCLNPNGTNAPEPGLSKQAQKSKSWGPALVKLFNNLSAGDKSAVVAVLQRPDGILLITKCSNNDLFWTHISLVGMSEVKPEAIPSGLPAAQTKKFRAYRLTTSGYQRLPSFLRMVRAQQWAPQPLSRYIIT